MSLASLTKNPALRKLIRNLDKGDQLFAQGSPGNSVFLVLAGELELIRRSQNTVFSLGKVGPGQFVGEKALLGGAPFNRMASAVATSDLTALELGPSEFAQMEKENTSVFVTLLKYAFKTLVDRQTQTEELLVVLREYEPEERFIQSIYRQALQSKENTPKGKVITIQPSVLAFQLNLPESHIRDWTKVLVSADLIFSKGDGFFLVPDETKILTFDRTRFQFSKTAA